METMKRRDFLGGILVSATGAAIVPATACARTAQKGFFAERGREIPLDESADVIVAGGGPAGIACAVRHPVASPWDP